MNNEKFSIGQEVEVTVKGIITDKGVYRDYIVVDQIGSTDSHIIITEMTTDNIKSMTPDVLLGDVYGVPFGKKWIAMRDTTAGAIRFIRLDSTATRHDIFAFFRLYPDAKKIYSL